MVHNMDIATKVGQVSHVYGWIGCDSKRSLLVPEFGPIVKVDAIANNILCLTGDGKLYVSSVNARTDAGKLEQLQLSSELFIDFSCSGDYIYLLDSKRRVRRIKFGQTNLETVLVQEPTAFCAHGYKKPGAAVDVVSLATGRNHKLYVAANGELWVEGAGPQTGLFSTPETGVVDSAVKLKFLQGRKALSVACGENFSVAVVEALPIQDRDTCDTNDVEERNWLASCPHCGKERGVSTWINNADQCPLGLPLNAALDENAIQQTDLAGENTKFSNTYNGDESRKFPNSNCDAVIEGATDALEELIGSANDTRIEASSSSEARSRSSYESITSSSTSTNSTTPVDLETHGDLERQESVDTQSSEDKKRSAIFVNTEAARQFLSRQLSWITSSSETTANLADDVKENVYHVANIVIESVKNVGDKVGSLSRHFTSEKSGEDGPKHVEAKAASLDMPSPRKLVRTSSCNLPVTEEHEDLPDVADMNQYFANLKNRRVLSHTEFTTEVWTWGSAQYGQLGVGDMLNRPQPTQIRTLVKAKVIKVVCGPHHCLALTLDGRVFGWGDNRYGQCAVESKPDVSTPLLMELPHGELIKDIACGSKFSLLLDHWGQVYFVGKNSDDLTSAGIIQLDFSLVPAPSDYGNEILQAIFCVGRFCIGQWSREHQSAENLLLEEKCHLWHQMKIQAEIAPLIHTPDIITDTTAATELKKLFSLHEKLCSLIAHQVYTLTQVAVHGRELSSLLFVINNVEYLGNVAFYDSLFCNSVACNALHLASETTLADSIVSLATLFYGEEEAGDIGAQFKLLLKEITFIPHRYRKALPRLVAEVGTRSEGEAEMVEMCVMRCTHLVDHFTVSLARADATREFWTKCPARISNAFRTGDRRLVRDSQTHPLSVANTGRFSSHRIVLFNDNLINIGYAGHTTYLLQTVWVNTPADAEDETHSLVITTPEDELVLLCGSAADKKDWSNVFQETIKSSFQQYGSHNLHVTPPIARNFSYTFLRTSTYKGATYEGQWLYGKMHGIGKLKWRDGRKYTGQFLRNVPHGYVTYEVPSATGTTVYEGDWVDGKMTGQGVIRYPNGDYYEGYVRDSLPHGHGILRQGQFVSSAASIYIGEWEAGVKNGYGVMDFVRDGEKYIGMWQNNVKQGSGMIVTLDGLYYEGSFSQNKMTGLGLMIFEDGTYYEGEFNAIGIFNGKGIMSFGRGDKIEGTFYGAWNEGLKVNGTFTKNVFPSEEKPVPTLLGKLCVPPDRKWESIFRESLELFSPSGKSTGPQKMWDNLAVAYCEAKARHKNGRAVQSSIVLDGLDRIPHYGRDSLVYDDYVKIQEYLSMAFSIAFHPLGNLLIHLTNVYVATYGGQQVHPRLLTHAVAELASLTDRLYSLVALLFPALPPLGEEFELPHDSVEDETQEQKIEVITAASLLHPYLMPRLYSELFVLYALHNKKKDDAYWERLLKWNKHPDVILMSFLGVDPKFWGGDIKDDGEKPRSLSSSTDTHFCKAVENLQLIKTTLTPMEKLQVLRITFQDISETACQLLGENYRLTMDDLFPLFLYVVVRSRVLQLGAEIHMVEDFMEPCIRNGELDIMFTTLKACYHQILREKPNVLA